MYKLKTRGTLNFVIASVLNFKIEEKANYL